MANKYFKVILFITFFVVATNMYAQGGPPPPPPHPCPSNNPNCNTPVVPIGNGIIYLIITAVAFGVKKIEDKNK